MKRQESNSRQRLYQMPAQSRADILRNCARRNVDQRCLTNRAYELAGLEVLLEAAGVHRVPTLRPDEAWLRLQAAMQSCQGTIHLLPTRATELENTMSRVLAVHTYGCE
jgi:hypothetical protein